MRKWRNVNLEMLTGHGTCGEIDNSAPPVKSSQTTGRAFSSPRASNESIRLSLGDFRRTFRTPPTLTHPCVPPKIEPRGASTHPWTNVRCTSTCELQPRGNRVRVRLATQGLAVERPRPRTCHSRSSARSSSRFDI